MTLNLNPNQNPMSVPTVSELHEGLMTPDMLHELKISGSVFVFRPGGVTNENVFATWAEVMTAADARPGLRFIQFDDDIVSPCVIPPGVWNMQDVIWTGMFGEDTDLSVSEGAIFTKLRAITSLLNITFLGSTPPVADFAIGGGNDRFLLQDGASIVCAGTGPFFRAHAPGMVATIGLLNGGQIKTGLTPVIDASVPGSVIISAVYPGGIFEPNTVSGVVGSQWISVILASSGQVFRTQPAFLGTYDNIITTKLRMIPGSVVVGSANPLTNEIVRCDPSAGGFPVNLPPAASCRGEFIIVKNVTTSINVISIVPDAGDTIDGNALGATIASDHGSLMFASDGISEWMIVGLV